MIPRSKTAQLFITADDSCKIYINGALSQPNANQPGDWRVVKQHNIKSLLQKGENVIAAEVKNGSGAAGLILRGEIITDAGKKINLYTNDSWRSSRQNYPHWESNAFQDAAWVPAKIIGDVHACPWITHNFLFSDLLADHEKSIWTNHQSQREKLMRIDVAGLSREKAPQVAVAYWKGRAFIDVNGKKIAPFAYISHRLIFQDFWSRQVANFGQAGVPILIINLPPFNKLGKTANNDDLNEKIDQEMRRHLNLNPDSYIIPSFTLNPPDWWLKENPDEWVGYACRSGRSE